MVKGGRKGRGEKGGGKRFTVNSVGVRGWGWGDGGRGGGRRGGGGGRRREDKTFGCQVEIGLWLAISVYAHALLSEVVMTKLFIARCGQLAAYAGAAGTTGEGARLGVWWPHLPDWLQVAGAVQRWRVCTWV